MYTLPYKFTSTQFNSSDPVVPDANKYAMTSPSRLSQSSSSALAPLTISRASSLRSSDHSAGRRTPRGSPRTHTPRIAEERRRVSSEAGVVFQLFPSEEYEDISEGSREAADLDDDLEDDEFRLRHAAIALSRGSVDDVILDMSSLQYPTDSGVDNPGYM